MIKRNLVVFFVFGFYTVCSAVPQLINYQGRIVVEGVNYNGVGQFKFALVDKGRVLGVRTATATATLSASFVTSVTVTDGGEGYVSPPSISFSGGGGSNVIATAEVNGGKITAITVHNAGSGYTDVPAVVIDAPPGGATVYTSYWSNDGSSVDGEAPTSSVSLPVHKGLYSVSLGDVTLANMNSISSSVFTNEEVCLRVWFSDGTNGWQQLSPDQRIASVGYAMVADTVSDGAITTKQLAAGAVTAKKLAPNAVTESLKNSGQAGVASSGVIMSTNENATNLLDAGYIRLDGLIRPQEKEWTLLSTSNAPSSREEPTVVWTGDKMIVWGGYRYNNGTDTYLNTGGVYDSTMDSWSPISTNNAPSSRRDHTAVWAGDKMIVFVRSNSSIYDPNTDSWTRVSPLRIPQIEGYKSVAVQMETNVFLCVPSGASNNAGLYNPDSDTWAESSTSPVQGYELSGFWTGNEVLILGSSGGSKLSFWKFTPRRKNYYLYMKP